jgi:AraC-like DNA-binding protein/ABC-type Fe3+-hydroxamate transport system substrate-binding protein
MEKWTLHAMQPVFGHDLRQLDRYGLYVIDPGAEEGQLYINGELIPIRACTIVVGEPGDTVKAEEATNGHVTLWEFRFDIAWEQAGSHLVLEGESGDHHRRLVRPVTDAHTMRLCLSIEQCWNGDALEQFRCQSLFQEMVYCMLRQMRHASRQDPRSAMIGTKSYMDRHYKGKLTIELLADMTGTSQGYFMQLFKTMYGTSPIEYIGERRIEKARRLLRQFPGMPLREIARQAGYDDEGYFSRRFRQKIGLSPAAYRTNNKFKAVALNYHTIGHLLALQMIPSAARLDPRYVRQYYERYHADVELHLDHLPDEESTRQMLIGHKPDVIVVRDNTDPVYVEQLKRLASVIVLPWNPSVLWRDLFRITAASLHKEELAERWLLQYERHADHVRARIPLGVRRESLLILSATETGVFVVGDRFAGAVLYEDIGMTPAFLPPAPISPLEPEKLESIAANRILLLADDSSAARAHRNRLIQHPVWSKLTAVREQKVFMVNRGLWFEYTPHAHLWSLNAAAALFS